MQNPDQKTYLHSIVEDGMEASIRLPALALKKAAASIWMSEHLDHGVLEAASKIIDGKSALLRSTELHQGHMLLMKAIDVVIENGLPKPATSLRTAALRFLHTPELVNPILDLVKNQVPAIKSRNGILEDDDIDAITFLILEKTDRPGEFVKTLTEAFQTTPPLHNTAHRIFASILLSRVRDLSAPLNGSNNKKDLRETPLTARQP